jgi:hypothetical protein
MSTGTESRKQPKQVARCGSSLGLPQTGQHHLQVGKPTDFLCPQEGQVHSGASFGAFKATDDINKMRDVLGCCFVGTVFFVAMLARKVLRKLLATTRAFAA